MNKFSSFYILFILLISTPRIIAQIKGADKVVYNPKTKEVTVNGGECFESSINGVIIAWEKCTPEHTT